VEAEEQMLQNIFETSTEIPHAMFYVTVVAVGLSSWVFMFTKEKKINLRDREPGDRQRESDAKDR
jgi:hypothetical protein